MHAKDYRDLFLLAAIWGGSFLFMRLSVADFGPLALVEVRLGFSALFLLGVAAVKGCLDDLRRNALRIGFVGLFGAGIPFLCFNYASQTVPIGIMAVVNALTPLFGALIAWAWLKEQLTPARVLGLLLGFTGILILVADDLSFDSESLGLGVLACLLAAACYGFAASYTTRYLRGIDPFALAAGSISGAALALLPGALLAWPSAPIPASSWAAALALSLICTGVAYIIFYGLIDRVGASRSITVTFLVPLFGILWGWLILDEAVTLRMMISTAVVLVGTLLATGFIQIPPRRPTPRTRG